jgi:hypothetical protein
VWWFYLLTRPRRLTDRAPLRIRLGLQFGQAWIRPEKRPEKLNYPHNNPLIWPGELADPSHIMQKLAEHTANSMRRNLRQNPDFPSQLSTVDCRLSTVN